MIDYLQTSDLTNGFLDLLNDFADTSNLDLDTAKHICLAAQRSPNVWILVYRDDDKVIGTATLFIEQKFIHNGSRVGHIEDVVVDKEYRNKGIGKTLIDRLVQIADSNGCYKVILDCNDENIPFYEKCGFHVKCVSMRKDIPRKDIVKYD